MNDDDVKLRIEVLTSSGWRSAELICRTNNKAEIGLKITFNEMGLAMALHQAEALQLAAVLAIYLKSLK